MVRIAVSAILLCLTTGLVYAMRRSKNNPNSVFRKSLFRVKSVRIFPIVSFSYAFFAVVIAFFGLLIIDRAGGQELNQREYLSEALMRLEQYAWDRDYPLLQIRGREHIRGEHPKILVLGDSFVWGEGLRNANQVWWQRMACELRKRGYDCEVYAVGYPGASTYDELLWLRNSSVLKEIDPDLVMIGYCTNDTELANLDLDADEQDENFIQTFREIIDQLVDGYKDLWSEQANPMLKVLPNLYSFAFIEMQKKAKRAYTDWEEEMAQGEYLEYFNTYAVQPLGELVAQLGIPTIVFPTPESPRGRNFELLYRDTMPLFEQAGIRVYNPLDKFIEKYPRPNRKIDRHLTVSPVNPHPGPATSWFLGAFAADILEQEYASVLGEKRTKEKAYPIEINDWMPFMLDPQPIQESSSVSQYSIEYPDQSSTADLENRVHGNFLTVPLRKKYVTLNFKNPMKLSSVIIEGEDLLSAEVHTLAINHELGFDDQNPVSLGRRKGPQCVWADKGGRDVTSLLISAKTKDGKQASLTVTIEGEVALW